MTDPFLTSAEIKRLTTKIRFKAQCRMLENMKIGYIADGRGAPLVARSVLFNNNAKPNHPEPDFSALRS